MSNGRLCGVIDFGQCCVGDPACDLTIAWTLLDERARKAFRTALRPDAGTWARGRAWALWKALIVAAGLVDTNANEKPRAWLTLGNVLADRYF
jgi:aminoglycoside phosphotransferase (APT) family kinase protein